MASSCPWVPWEASQASLPAGCLPPLGLGYPSSEFSWCLSASCASWFQVLLRKLGAGAGHTEGGRGGDRGTEGVLADMTCAPPGEVAFRWAWGKARAECARRDRVVAEAGQAGASHQGTENQPQVPCLRTYRWLQRNETLAPLCTPGFRPQTLFLRLMVLSCSLVFLLFSLLRVLSPALLPAQSPRLPHVLSLSSGPCWHRGLQSVSWQGCQARAPALAGGALWAEAQQAWAFL